MGRTAPFRLLHAVADYLEATAIGRFSLRLVRHPDFEQTLEREPLEGCSGCSVAEALARSRRVRRRTVAGSDCTLLGFLVGQVDRTSGDRGRCGCEARQAIARRLAGRAAPFADWLPLMREFLERVYGDGGILDERTTGRTAKGNCRGHDWPEETTTPRITAADAMRWLATRNAAEKIERCNDESKLQRAEWPDAAWCDAESIVFVGFNEGRLPTSQRSGLFLPNGLRERLSEAVGDGRRIADDDLRYALDAYRLCAAMAGRKETCSSLGDSDLRTNRSFQVDSGSQGLPRRYLTGSTASTIRHRRNDADRKSEEVESQRHWIRSAAPTSKRTSRRSRRCGSRPFATISLARIVSSCDTSSNFGRLKFRAPK